MTYEDVAVKHNLSFPQLLDIISDFIEAQQRITQIVPFDPTLETTTDLAQVAHEGFQKFCQDYGEEAARDLLTLFSVKKFSEIAPANYDFLIQEIEKRRQQTQ